MHIVDSHFHVWDLDLIPQPWIDRESMAAINRSFVSDDYLGQLHLRSGKSNQISGVLVQTIHNPKETAHLLTVAGSVPQISAVVGWADMRATDFAEQLGYLRSHPHGQKLRGLRYQLQEEDGNGALDSEQFHGSLAHLTDLGLTFDLIIRADQLPAAAACAQRHPHQKFVLDHLAKPPLWASPNSEGTLELQEWAAQIKSLAQLPNVYAKLSGLMTLGSPELWDALKCTYPPRAQKTDPHSGKYSVPPDGSADENHVSSFLASMHAVVNLVLQWFGPTRIMFGSDWPVLNLASDFWTWVDIVQQQVGDLSPHEQHAVWYGTATNFYSLNAPQPPTHALE